MTWTVSDRYDPLAVPFADRHYNRRTVGAPQFVPPGRCLVLRTSAALWVTSWPFAAFVRHRWPGAWVNSLFRREGGPDASTLILEAIAATRWVFGEPPPLGIVSFVDPRHVRPTFRRGQALYGYCFWKAGFIHDGETKKHGLWAWRLPPDRMPPAAPPRGIQPCFPWELTA